MSLHYGLTDLCGNHCTDIYSSKVPGVFPSQLEILSTGQTYFSTDIILPFAAQQLEAQSQVGAAMIYCSAQMSLACQHLQYQVQHSLKCY